MLDPLRGNIFYQLMTPWQRVRRLVQWLHQILEEENKGTDPCAAIRALMEELNAQVGELLRDRESKK